jgi:phage baseplate assembly protein W
MLSRADTITQLDKKQELFSDFLDNFDKHPISHGLIKITNEQSIKQSLRNLILTNLGERLFQPNIGSNIHRALFEPNDIVTAENISFYIKNTIQYNEPRVNVLNIEVLPDVSRYSFNVNIIFSVINSTTPVTLNLILKRVR